MGIMIVNFFTVFTQNLYQSAVEPIPSFNGIKSTNYDVMVLIKLVLHLLNSTIVTKRTKMQILYI